MKAKKNNGTGENICACGSWLDHWKKYGSQALPRYCTEAKCMHAPEVGAHIQKDGSSDNGWYIVPLCSAHNAEKGRSLNVSDAVQLVPADISITCGKKDAEERNNVGMTEWGQFTGTHR